MVGARRPDRRGGGGQRDPDAAGTGRGGPAAWLGQDAPHAPLRGRPAPRPTCASRLAPARHRLSRRPDARCRLPGGGRRRGTRPRRRRLPSRTRCRRASLGRSASDVAAAASQPPSPMPWVAPTASSASPHSRPALLSATASPPRPALLTAAAPGAAPSPAATSFRGPGNRARARGLWSAECGCRSSCCCCVVGPPPSARRADWRATERAAQRASWRARSRRGARGVRGPEEGRGGGWERPGAAPNQCARLGGGASPGPAPPPARVCAPGRLLPQAALPTWVTTAELARGGSASSMSPGGLTSCGGAGGLRSPGFSATPPHASLASTARPAFLCLRASSVGISTLLRAVASGSLAPTLLLLRPAVKSLAAPSPPSCT